MCLWKIIYGKTPVSAWILLLDLLHKLVTCSLKFSFLLTVTLTRFWESEFSSAQAGSKSLMSRLDGKWHLLWLVFVPFSWNHLNSLTHVFCNFLTNSSCFFPCTITGVFISITCNIYITMYDIIYYIYNIIYQILSSLVLMTFCQICM